MGLTHWQYTGGSREVSLAHKPIAPGQDPEGVRDELRRDPKMIMWIGVAIVVILSFVSGVFGTVGLLVTLFGACLLKRRTVAADRYYAQKRAEQEIYKVWQSTTGRCAEDNAGGSQKVTRPDSTFNDPPVMSGGSLLETGRISRDESLDTAPTPHSDAA